MPNIAVDADLSRTTGHQARFLERSDSRRLYRIGTLPGARGAHAADDRGSRIIPMRGCERDKVWPMIGRELPIASEAERPFLGIPSLSRARHLGCHAHSLRRAQFSVSHLTAQASVGNTQREPAIHNIKASTLMRVHDILHV